MDRIKGAVGASWELNKGGGKFLSPAKSKTVIVIVILIMIVIENSNMDGGAVVASCQIKEERGKGERGKPQKAQKTQRGRDSRNCASHGTGQVKKHTKNAEIGFDHRRGKFANRLMEWNPVGVRFYS